MADSSPKGPFRLVTVNTAPERAKKVIGRLTEALKDRYTIIHVDNAESMQCFFFFCLELPYFTTFSTLTWTSLTTEIEEVPSKVTEHQPDILVSC
jgi:hypothetical protein